ncbi:uncharacterized protein A1O9_12997 [Exophiala aquamarina CBS 119918]|uniref:Uncharacterized protein n=1 Tax=Exophiala aquamarina CBS 119918 TaxID=1182545 RepID=A0A072NUB3_9EURO|nr:uncharacterized protein A1O9_12997 [Exophiala aquamarina CBS 119918]KEF50957.1 hypothetical protein A1O9_12997 [Exophiala aquamarina CBS 119918]
MATFIAYQLRAYAPPFDNHTFSRSPTIGSSTCTSSRQSSRSPNQTKSVGKADFMDFVDFVDLTPTHQDTPRKCLVLPELREPIDISDLSSLHEILTQNDKQFGGSDAIGCEVFASPALVDGTCRERGRESDSEETASLTATTATSVRLGASQDNPIVLDDDQLVDTHHKDTVPPNDEKPTCKPADPAYPGDEPLLFSKGCVDPRTDDGKHTLDCSAKNSTAIRASHEQQQQEEEGNESHNDNAAHTRDLARGNGDDKHSGGGVDSDAPASVGRIHDVVAEYEETFGFRKSKQNAAHSTPHECGERETTVGAIPRGVLQEEPRTATDDGVTDVK